MGVPGPGARLPVLPLRRVVPLVRGRRARRTAPCPRPPRLRPRPLDQPGGLRGRAARRGPQRGEHRTPGSAHQVARSGARPLGRGRLGRRELPRRRRRLLARVGPAARRAGRDTADPVVAGHRTPARRPERPAPSEPPGMTTTLPQAGAPATDVARALAQRLRAAAPHLLAQAPPRLEDPSADAPELLWHLVA